MKCRLVTLVVCLLMGAAGPAFAQGGTTSTISGVVVDTAGGVVPGADVQITQNATGVTQSGVSNAEGAFSFPGLNVGTYTVTVTLQGFKTFVANDVVLTSGAPASIKATLEIGGLEEQIVVSSTSEIVQTQSTVISSTINTNQIVKLPITSRSAMDFVTLLPGVTTAGGNRQSQINGLPRGVINITLDGVNIQDNTLRSTDGFFAIVSPRLDAIEEVTVTTATQEASAGQGAVQIKFVTRSGGNDFTGSGYHYYRSDKLNANTWFNNRNDVDKAELKQNQYGVRAGGPIVIPGLFDGRNKAFFFGNYEEFRQPSGVTRNRNVLNTTAQQGIYTYTTAGGATQSVNLLALAARERPDLYGGSRRREDPERHPRRGHRRFDRDHRPEPRAVHVQRRHDVAAPLSDDAHRLQHHRQAPLQQRVQLQLLHGLPGHAEQHGPDVPGISDQRGPDVRAVQHQQLTPVESEPEPGERRPGGLERRAGHVLRRTDARRLERHLDCGSARIPDRIPRHSGDEPGQCQSDRGLQSSVAECFDSPHRGHGHLAEGAAQLTMGGSWTQFDLWLKNQQMVPNLFLGARLAASPNLVTGDPAQAMFNTTNFPGASAAQLAAAQALYATVTGRVTEILGNAALSEGTNQYEYLGNSVQRARMREAGFFVQDSWRIRPDLTINAGLRYELQFPFSPRNNSYSTATLDSFCGISGTNPSTICNLFQAGNTPGPLPTFIAFGEGTAAFETDTNNWAPSLGAAWTLKGSTGVLGRILGRSEGDSVVRAATRAPSAAKA